LLDGKIEVKSGGRGRGCEFTVTIPLVPKPSVEPEAAKANGPAARVSGRKIVVIDDERDVADLLARLLKRLGHEVWTAYGGKSGIETVLEHRPDAVLVDIAMPDLDGYEVARRLRERLPGVVLIAVTGFAQRGDEMRARTAGFDHHLAKPVKVGQIEELLAAGEAGARQGK